MAHNLDQPCTIFVLGIEAELEEEWCAYVVRDRGAELDVRGGGDRAEGVVRHHCPGHKPPFLAVKRPARPYKSAIENRFV